MIIRAATADDWPQIWPFWHRIAVAAETYSWDPETDSNEARSIWMQPPPARMFAVEDGTEVVGSARLNPNYGPASKIASASFLVDPDRHGQGIGRRLVQHVLDEARADGFRAMVFNAVVETNTSAVHLYKSMGFTIIGTVPEAFEHPSVGWVGLLIMHIAL